MVRTLAGLLALLLLTRVANSSPPPASTAAIHPTSFAPADPDNRFVRSLADFDSAHLDPVALACYTVSSVGKAIGHACISREKTCHVGQRYECAESIRHPSTADLDGLSHEDHGLGGKGATNLPKSQKSPVGLFIGAP
jgi:hypothetical protein